MTDASADLRLRADQVDWVESDGEVIALDHSAMTYLGANPAASLLWPELARGTARDRLIELLQQTYGIGAERAGADVNAFLAVLAARGLLA